MSEEEIKIVVPEEFSKVLKDFVRDLIVTFPEYEPLINKWWLNPNKFEGVEDETETKTTEFLFDFCVKKFPPRFFDILYQNDEMFKEDSDTDTEFLPNIHFKNLWQCDITDKTRETIWKYLQLITFSIVGNIDNKDAFGDTAKLFEAIDANEFKSKLEETLSHMQNLFNNTNINTDDTNDTDEKNSENLSEGLNMGDIPDPTEIHKHITEMMDGKLGQLAREIAEETATEMNMDIENNSDMQDVFQKLLKNPTKLMGLVKNVGSKIDSKLKSGDIKESELIAEATDIIGKMKNMPGMKDIQSMLSKMGMGNMSNMSNMGNMGNMGKMGKMNVNAMESKLNKQMKMAKMRERCKEKAELNAKMKEPQQQQHSNIENKPSVSEEELLKIFNSTDKPERTPRNANPNQSNKNKNKKNKNK